MHLQRHKSRIFFRNGKVVKEWQIKDTRRRNNNSAETIVASCLICFLHVRSLAALAWSIRHYVRVARHRSDVRHSSFTGMPYRWQIYNIPYLKGCQTEGVSTTRRIFWLGSWGTTSCSWRQRRNLENSGLTLWPCGRKKYKMRKEKEKEREREREKEKEI